MKGGVLMGMYDYERVKKTFFCTEHQDNKLKSYCKVKCISQSMLFRLFIDELRVYQIDSSIRRNIQEISFKIDNLLGSESEPRYEEGFNEAGRKKQKWFTKTFH